MDVEVLGRSGAESPTLTRSGIRALGASRRRGTLATSWGSWRPSDPASDGQLEIKPERDALQQLADQSSLTPSRLLSQLRLDGDGFEPVRLAMLKFRHFQAPMSLPGLSNSVTLLTLSFVAWAMAGQAAGLRTLTISALGWCWMMLALGLSWRAVGECPQLESLVLRLGRQSDPSAPIYLGSNLLKYLPGGIWHFVKRVRLLASSIGTGPALVSVLLEPMLMAVAAMLWVPFGGFQVDSRFDSLACLASLPRWRSRCCAALSASGFAGSTGSITMRQSH